MRNLTIKYFIFVGNIFAFVKRCIYFIRFIRDKEVDKTLFLFFILFLFCSNLSSDRSHIYNYNLIFEK